MRPQQTQDTSSGFDLLMEGVATSPEGARFRIEADCCDTLVRVRSLSELAASGRLTAAHLRAELSEIKTSQGRVTLTPRDADAIVEEMGRLKGFSRDDPTLKNALQQDATLQQLVDSLPKVIQNEASIFSLRERSARGEITSLDASQQISTLQMQSQHLRTEPVPTLNTSLGFDPLADLLGQNFEVSPPPVLTPPCCALREAEALAKELSSVLASAPGNLNHIRELSEAMSQAAERAIDEGNQKQAVAETLRTHLGERIIWNTADAPSILAPESAGLKTPPERMAPPLSPNESPPAALPQSLSHAPPIVHEQMPVKLGAPVPQVTQSNGDASAPPSLRLEVTQSTAAHERRTETPLATEPPPLRPSPSEHPSSLSIEAPSRLTAANNRHIDSRLAETQAPEIRQSAQLTTSHLRAELPRTRTEASALVNHLIALRREYPATNAAVVLAGELGTRALTTISRAETRTIDALSISNPSALRRELSLLVEGLRLSDRWSRAAARVNDSSLTRQIARGLAASGIRGLRPEETTHLALLARHRPDLLGRNLTSLLQANQLLSKLTRAAHLGSSETLQHRLSKMLTVRGIKDLPLSLLGRLSRIALNDPAQFVREVSALLGARALASPPRLGLDSLLHQTGKNLTEMASRLSPSQLATRISATLRMLGVTTLPDSSLTALVRLARQNPQAFSRALKDLYRLEASTQGSVVDRIQRLSQLLETLPRPHPHTRAYLAQAFSLRELSELRNFLKSSPATQVGGISRRELLAELNAARAFLTQSILLHAQGPSSFAHQTQYRQLLSAQRRLLIELNRCRPTRDTLVSRADPHIVALVSRITEIEAALARYASEEIENDLNVRKRHTRRLSRRLRSRLHSRISSALASSADRRKSSQGISPDVRTSRRRAASAPTVAPPITTASAKGRVVVVAAKRTPSRSLDVVQSEQKDGRRNSYYDPEGEAFRKTLDEST